MRIAVAAVRDVLDAIGLPGMPARGNERSIREGTAVSKPRPSAASTVAASCPRHAMTAVTFGKRLAPSAGQLTIISVADALEGCSIQIWST